MQRHLTVRTMVVVLFALLALPASGRAELSASVEEELRQAKYVYISSTRKDGTLGEPAEIWFMYDNGAVYVGTRPTSWRVKRIRWGRPQAKIWVGRRDGPSFAATGAVVQDRGAQERLLETFAKKYPEGWPKYEAQFRRGFEDGSRVLVRYAPK